MVDDVGICVKCKNSPVKIYNKNNGWYCQECLFEMAELYLKKKYVDDKIIMEAQKIINENKKT